MSVLAHTESDEELPAWSLPASAGESILLPSEWPDRVTREWAWGGATGAGVRVCVLDSGVELDHPRVGTVQRSVAVSKTDDEITVTDDTAGDLCGHGTACAGIIRSLAPECELTSVRVLGAGYTGSAAVLITGLEWAIDQGFDIINMSLSTTKKQYVDQLHALADAAYFKRTMLIASAHNMPVESFPWRFAAVVSVGSHESPDPFVVYANPRPPVEFFARGLNVEIAWLGGETITATGNSFATPHIAGICALILSKHRQLTPFQLKSVLHLTSTNVGGGA
jgi:subtilisin family serine protease